MKKIKEIKGIINVSYENKNKFYNNCFLYYNNDSKLIFMSTEDLSIIASIQMDSRRGLTVRNNNLWMPKDGNIYIYDKNSQKFNLFWKSKKGGAWFFEDCIIEDIEEKDKVHTFLYDYASQNLLWDKTYYNNKIGCSSIGSYLYAVDLMMNNYSFIDKNTGKIIYDLNFKDDELSGKRFYLYNNILSIPLSNEHLLGINADTGEKLWEIENAHLFYNQDKETGLLYGIGNNYYIVIDPNVGKIIIDKKFDDTYDGKYLSMDPYGSICGNRLYFINHISGNRFGAINLNTHEIEFVQDMKAKGRINTIQYCNGKLYITDLGNTLHIFEE